MQHSCTNASLSHSHLVQYFQLLRIGLYNFKIEALNKKPTGCDRYPNNYTLPYDYIVLPALIRSWHEAGDSPCLAMMFC